MPVDANKTPSQILDLPTDLADLAQLVGILNDRIHQINGALQLYVANPSPADVSIGTHRITELADPKDDLDGVNLRTLKRAVGEPVEQTGGTGDGIEEPTIYFTFDGLPFDGEESPYAMILPNRDGFAPTAVGLTAVGAPTAGSLKINLAIVGLAGDMLTVDLELPEGENGMRSTTGFRLPGAFKTGTKVQAIITRAGGATQVTIALGIKGK